ncbi:MAG: undecaprenyl-diphosphate phosphatase [Candidatus Kryptoniota bacterium]
MLSYLQGIILGILQGVTELFPMSSLGHSVILPKILGWDIDQQSPFFLMFLVATHSSTALVLLLFFLKDWRRIVSGLFRSVKERKINDSDSDAKLAWLLIVGTIPAGLVGLLLKHFIRKFLLSGVLAAVFLLLNGLLLFGADALRRKALISNAVDSDLRISKMTWWQAFKVGLMQVLALIPGFSRTGSTLAGSLMVGLSHEDSVRFSFLLATPIIGAAAALELPKLFTSGNSAAIGVSLVGGLSAALFSYLSVKFLTAYFKIENRKLTPFALYCVVAGAGSLIYFLH